MAFTDGATLKCNNRPVHGTTVIKTSISPMASFLALFSVHETSCDPASLFAVRDGPGAFVVPCARTKQDGRRNCSPDNGLNDPTVVRSLFVFGSSRESTRDDTLSRTSVPRDMSHYSDSSTHEDILLATCCFTLRRHWLSIQNMLANEYTLPKIAFFSKNTGFSFFSFLAGKHKSAFIFFVRRGFQDIWLHEKQS